MRALLPFLLSALFLAAASTSRAQTADDLNDGCRVVKTAVASEYEFSWWGKSGHSYFIQVSTDLVNWTYAPDFIEGGNGIVMAWGMTTNAPRCFLRLRHINQTAANLDTADFDGDGLSNLREITAAGQGGPLGIGTGTDPLSEDTDGDGDRDADEVVFGSSPVNATDTLISRLLALQAQGAIKIEQLEDALDTGAVRSVLAPLFEDLRRLDETLLDLWKAATRNPQAAPQLDVIGGIDDTSGEIGAVLLKMEDEPSPEARTRATHDYVNPDGNGTYRTGYWSERPYENPPPGSQPPYEHTDFSEPITAAYSSLPFPTWEQSARGHGTPYSTGFFPVAYSSSFGPDEEHNDFSHTEIRLFRENGMEPTQRFMRMRYEVSWWNASGNYQMETRFYLVTLGFGEREGVTSSGAIQPLGVEPMPPGISISGGILRMVPTPEYAIYKAVYLEPIAGPLVRLYKQGETPGSGNPMVVLQNENLVFEFDPNDGFLLPLASNALKWELAQLNHQGQWNGYVEVGSGQTCVYQPAAPGIFRLRVKIGDTMTVNLARTSHDAYIDPQTGRQIIYGHGRVGSPDAFGVVSDPLQKLIWAAARGHLLSNKFSKQAYTPPQYGFGSVAPGSTKCNIFVAHAASEAGALVPMINGFILQNDPPRAAQWAGEEDALSSAPGFQDSITGWHGPDAFSMPQPGIILSHGGSPGHCGLLDYDGYGLSASSAAAPYNIVNRKLTLRLANKCRFPNQ